MKSFTAILLLIFVNFSATSNATTILFDTGSVKSDTTIQKQELMIDTSFMDAAKEEMTPEFMTDVDTSVQMQTEGTGVLTNFQMLVYILLSVLGLALFFFIFVQTLFKTFHKTRSTRQSLHLSWNLFFLVSVIWLFIIWGIVAKYWTSAAFTVSMVFLMIISLIMLIIAVKSKN